MLGIIRVPIYFCLASLCSFATLQVLWQPSLVGFSINHTLNVMYFIQPGRACALRALGLSLAEGYLTVGLGKTFLLVGCFFYENGRTSETKSRKIDPKVQNGPSFGNPSFLAKKNVHFWLDDMF